MVWAMLCPGYQGESLLLKNSINSLLCMRLVVGRFQRSVFVRCGSVSVCAVTAEIESSSLAYSS